MCTHTGEYIWLPVPSATGQQTLRFDKLTCSRSTLLFSSSALLLSSSSLRLLSSSSRRLFSSCSRLRCSRSCCLLASRSLLCCCRRRTVKLAGICRLWFSEICWQWETPWALQPLLARCSTCTMQCPITTAHGCSVPLSSDRVCVPLQSCSLPTEPHHSLLFMALLSRTLKSEQKEIND